MIRDFQISNEWHDVKIEPFNRAGTSNYGHISPEVSRFRHQNLFLLKTSNRRNFASRRKKESKGANCLMRRVIRDLFDPCVVE